MESVNEVYNGQDGRSTVKFLNQFREGRPVKARRDIEEGLPVPDWEVHNVEINELEDAISEFNRSILRGHHASKHGRRLQRVRVQELELMKERRDRMEATHNRMITAAEDALKWIDENSGEVIKTIVKSFKAELDPMVKLRKVLADIKNTHGGTPNKVRGMIEEELNAIEAVTTVAEVRPLLAQFTMLWQEQQSHYMDNPQAARERKIDQPISDVGAVIWLREHLSNRAEPLKTLREWFDQKWVVEPTWEVVNEYVLWWCQRDVKSVDEKTENRKKAKSTKAGKNNGHEVHQAATASMTTAAEAGAAAGAAAAQAILRANAAWGRNSGGYGSQGGGGNGKAYHGGALPDGRCRFYEHFGRCKFGKNCRFRHGRGEGGDEPSQKKVRFVEASSK